MVYGPNGAKGLYARGRCSPAPGDAYLLAGYTYSAAPIIPGRLLLGTYTTRGEGD